MTSWQVHINPSASWWSRLAGLGGGIRQKLSSQTAETRIISRPSVGRAPPAWNGTFLSGILSDITQNLKLSCKHLHVVATEVKAAPWKLFLETYSIYPCFHEFSSFFSYGNPKFCSYQKWCNLWESSSQGFQTWDFIQWEKCSWGVLLVNLHSSC